MLRNHAFLGVSLAFAFGILVCETSSLWLVGGFFAFLLVVGLQLKSFSAKISLLLLVLCVAFGFGTHALNGFSGKYFPTQQRVKLALSAQEKLSSNAQNDKYFACIQDTRILVYVSKRIGEKIHLGAKTMVSGRFANRRFGSNLYAFDYSRHLLRKDIAQGFYVDSVYENPVSPSWRFRLHAKIESSLAKLNLNASSLLFVRAMFLGKRDAITADNRMAFQRAGVVHILAISGLHVGLLFGLMYGFLGLFIGRHSLRAWRIFLALGAIWLYIYFVGFRPSALRAGLMLSIYFANDLLRQPRNALHAVALSAFVLLCLDTQNLFDLGFQLSFSAVLGLVIFFPLVHKKIPLRKTSLRYLRDLVASSCIAQFCTAPLVLYHFGFFSFWFLLGNLVLIPAAPILLLFSLVSALLGLFDSSFAAFAATFNFLSDGIMQYIFWLSHFSIGIFEQVRFTELHVVLSVLLLGLIFILIKKTNLIRVVLFLSVLGLFAVEGMLWKHRSQNKREVLVFQSYKPSILIRSGSEYVHAYVGEKTASFSDYYLQPFIRNEGGEIRERLNLENHLLEMEFQNASIQIYSDSLIIKGKNGEQSILLEKNTPFKRIAF